MRCSNCGKKLADGETFCPICGQKAPVQRTQAYTPPPPPPPQPTPPPAPQPIPSPTPIKVNGLRSAAGTAAASAKSFLAVGNRMKYVKIGAVIVAVVLVFMFISGFFASNSKKIIGTWELVEEENGGASNYVSMEFKSGDLVTLITKNGNERTRFYSVNGDRLAIIKKDRYGFTDNQEVFEIEKLSWSTLVLKLTNSGDRTTTFEKK